jgi:hypothetical protein
MKTKIIEATNYYHGGMNHGKFLVGKFDEKEFSRRSVLADKLPLLKFRWAPTNVLVLDLETGEGAIFAPHGYAKADLNDKHQIWVCPLYERFLTWLYKQDLTDLDKLPDVVKIEDPDSALYGYRRTKKDKVATAHAGAGGAQSPRDRT